MIFFLCLYWPSLNFEKHYAVTSLKSGNNFKKIRLIMKWHNDKHGCGMPLCFMSLLVRFSERLCLIFCFIYRSVYGTST